MISNDIKDPWDDQKPEEDEEWENEVPEYLRKRIDQIVEQIQKEPLPEPAKSKRRKTKGKKKFDRKVLSSNTMGLGEQLTEIKTNVIETRQALLNMYKIDKERFEFINYNEAFNNYDIKKLKIKYQLKLKNYRERIDLINLLSKKINAKPIFVTNIQADGHREKIFIMNYMLINHCEKQKYYCR